MVPKKFLVPIVVVAMAAAIGIGLWFGRPGTRGDQKNILRKDILSTQHNVTLTYADYDPKAAADLSSFEEKDDLTWKGNGFYDDRTALAGKTSLSLTSTNREVGVAYTDNLSPLENVALIETAVRVTDPDDLEALVVYAGTPDKPHAYRFPVANLRQEWNVLRMDRDKFIPEAASNETPSAAASTKATVLPWEQVTRIEFDLTSRPGVTIIANFDGLRIEREKKYRDDWNVNVGSFLGLGNFNNQIYLLGRGIGSPVATMHAVTAAQDFTYQAKLIPRNDKRSGLFFRGDFRSNNGYIFWVGGVDQSTWGVNARSLGVDDVLAAGELNNVRFRKDEPIWLKVETKGENIAVSISLNGKDYTKLQDIVDTTFLEPGGVGIFVEGGGETLFNDFAFSQ